MKKYKFEGITLNGTKVTGYLFAWIRYGKEIPIIGEGVKNGSVMGFEVVPETIKPLF